MTNQELSAAIRDLDEQLEDFIRQSDAELHWAVQRIQGIQIEEESGDEPRIFREMRERIDEGSLRITEAPEPHQPTKWLGWLLVTFAACVLVWLIARAK